MNLQSTKAWQEFEAGKEYKRRIGLYETVRRNERFYRGDQWYGTQDDLPRPVFNLIRRITDHLVCSVAPKNISIRYTDEKLPFLNTASMRESVTEGIRLLNNHASYRWKRNYMESLVQNALLNAAISGDGVFYCWWDANAKSGQPFAGDICTDLIDNTDLFVADVHLNNLQAQEYILLAGRAKVSALRREAIAAGMDAHEAERMIQPDSRTDDRAGDLSSVELNGSETATYLIRFSREGGEVVFEKSTRNCVIRRTPTGLKYYPVTYFNWHPMKGSFHGGALVSDMIANQKYINTAYAMAMKHMRDTAFSKVVYDKSRIPEWSNEVGEAIGAMGGGNIADAVSVIGVGKMQDGYLELISNVIDTTKGMMGATESALGNEKATNTSAILALQEASQIGLTRIRGNLCKCLGELASIWADMICTYSHEERRIIVDTDSGIDAKPISYRVLKDELLRATAEIDSTTLNSNTATMSLLERLLDQGHLTVSQFLKLLPPNTVCNRDTILKEVQTKGALENE